MTGYRIVVLASGRGSNLRALLDAERNGRLGGGQVACVASNRPGCDALRLAREAGIETLAYDPRDFDSREGFDQTLLGLAMLRRPDLLVCAGFMRVLGADAVQLAGGRMINIHPSLLPAFPGLDPHGQAIRAGVTISGATVHFVIPETDAGPIIMQGAVPVAGDDTAETLAARVLQLEHRIYPQALRLLAQERVRVADGRCRVTDGTLPQGNLISPA